jgi:ABC-2 type transport system permease protein
VNSRSYASIDDLRIVWAIAAKDIADAVKNKTFLSIIIGMAMLMLSTQAFPFLIGLSAKPSLIVYDAGGSSGGDSGVLTKLREDGRYRLIEVDSAEELEGALVSADAEVLGLIVPAGVDPALAAGNELELDGYVAWSRRSAADELRSDLEATLRELLGQPVSVNVAGHIVYPPPEGGGSAGMVAIVLVLILTITGGFLVPYLMLEEKQTHTLDALLVSPASIRHIVAGKALAGLAYCLVAAAVVLAFHWSMVVRWEVAIVATLCGAVLTVGLGLLLGSLFENAQQTSLLMGLPALVLILPVVLAAVGASLPDPLAGLLPWTPTVALGKAYLVSFSGAATLARALGDLAIVLAWAVPIYGVVVWLVRRSDR